MAAAGVGTAAAFAAGNSTSMDEPTCRTAGAGDERVLCGWSMEVKVGDSPHAEANDVTFVEHGRIHLPESAQSTSSVGVAPNRTEM